MKIAYNENVIMQAGPNFGTLRNVLIGEVAPTLERKMPPTLDIVNNYSNNLIYVGDFPVRLSSSTTSAIPIKRMRVRLGKPGPNGKPRTRIELLAKAEEQFAFGKLEKRVRNEDFNKFGEVKVKHTNKDAVHKQINGTNFEYTKVLKGVKQSVKLKSVALANNNILMAVNGLFRQILLFKGIGFAQIEQDIREAKKPVTYNVNTMIEADPFCTKKDIHIRRFKVHSITVQKTFRDIENVMGVEQEHCNMYFSGTCCKEVTMWIKSLKFVVE